MKESRGRKEARWIDVLCRLLDGNPKRLVDFRDIAEDYGVSFKTIRRDLASMMTSKRLNLIFERRWVPSQCEFISWWRLEGQLVPTKVVAKTKVCNKCEKEKPIDQFYRDRYRADGRQDACKDCKNQQSYEWSAKNRKRRNASQRRNYRKRRLRLLQEQNELRGQ